MSDLLATLADWAQIVSVPLAIVGIVLSIWLYRRGRQRRAISCVFDPLTSPVEIKAGDALRGEIKILYRGQPVSNLFMIRATIKNTGNLPIRKTDVVEPLTFMFRPSAELVRQPQTVNTKPDNIQATWSVLETETPARVTIAQLEFDLLNPGEELTAEFLCTGESSVPKLTARIEGITQIDVADSQEMRWRKEIRSAAIVGIAAILMGLSLPIFQEESSLLYQLSSGLIAGATAGLLQGVSPLIKLIKYRRSKLSRS